jgi:pyruvate dehydrogenase E2 component (dihydrolipoamide acetyltransferase)
MATKVVMAQLSPTMEEGRLLEWKVEEGAAVSQGDVLAEIETDKANMEVEALGGGVMRKILVAAGQTVPVGTLIGVIAEADEDIEALLAGATAAGAAPAAPAATSEAQPAPQAISEARSAAPAQPVTEAPATPDDGRVKASPVARKIARERGLDLRTIAGSGPGGRIVKADVEAAPAGAAPVEPAPATMPAAPPAPAATDAAPWPAPTTVPTAAEATGPSRLEERVVEASQMRKAIARRLAESIGPVPHFFLTTEIDMGRALDLRAELNSRRTDGKIGVNDLLLKAAAEALVRNPAVYLRRRVISSSGEETARWSRRSTRELPSRSATWACSRSNSSPP